MDARKEDEQSIKGWGKTQVGRNIEKCKQKKGRMHTRKEKSENTFCQWDRR